MEKYHSPLLLYGLAEYREALQRFRNVVANYPDDPICDDVFMHITNLRGPEKSWEAPV